MSSGDSVAVDRAQLVRNAMMGGRIAAMVSLGIRLGLYAEMKDIASFTSVDLANRTNYHERWVREWLHGQVASGIVAYDGDGRFQLTADVATLLADEDALDYTGHVFDNLPYSFSVIERMPEVFRSGRGISWDDRGEGQAERMEKAFRNWYREVLVPKALPSLDGVVSRLVSGAMAADVGCGAGLALIEMAREYPKSEFHGYETSTHALRRAETNKDSAGATNVFFHHAEDDPLPADGSFALICTLDCLHDMTRPQDAAAAIRRAVMPDGVWFIADVNCGETLEENLADPLAPMKYMASVFSCLSSGLSEPGGAGLGTLGLPEAKMKELVESAGFTRFRRLDLPSPINAYYEARV